MKKVLALILALVMVTALFAGCAGGEDKPAADNNDGEKTYKIIYVTPSTASDFWSQVEIGIKQATKDYEEQLGIKIDYSSMGPAQEADAEGYVKAFENAIAAKPDAILTATLNIDPTVPKAKEAHDAGIVLNFVNCSLGNGNDSADAQADAEGTISAHGSDLIGIYAGNNVTCDGVCAALRNADMKEGVVSVGVDSDDIEIAALRDGYLSAIIVQDAFTQGYKTMENAILTLTQGKNPEAEQQVNIPPVIVTAENIDSEEIQFMMSPYVK